MPDVVLDELDRAPTMTLLELPPLEASAARALADRYGLTVGAVASAAVRVGLGAEHDQEATK